MDSPRLTAWRAWIAGVKQQLAATAPGETNPSTDTFFRQHWAAHTPCTLPLPEWPALAWTLDSLSRRLGDVPVQVQTNRLADPAYELRSPEHRGQMPFSAFIELVRNGPDNDVYMTAQNAAHNSGMLSALYPDLQPLPGCLRPDPSTAFLWIGRGTTTPLHHDMTSNMLCQIIGEKRVRLFAPEQIERLDNHVGVHSSLGWVTDETIAARGLFPSDVTLQAGHALFIPVGWWHCIRAPDVSVTAVFTSFVWPNVWTDGFPL